MINRVTSRVVILIFIPRTVVTRFVNLMEIVYYIAVGHPIANITTGIEVLIHCLRMLINGYLH